MRGYNPRNASWDPIWFHSLKEHLIVDKPRLESFWNSSCELLHGEGGGGWEHLQPSPSHTDTISSFYWICPGPSSPKCKDADEFLQLVISSTCRPTLGPREFITNQPLTLFHEASPSPTPPNPPRSNCLHAVIRQINGRAWNVAFASTKVKCCREGVAFRLWLVDYALPNPLNADIIWWSCQFAVCALSAPQSPVLLPLPKTKADFGLRWLLRRIWSWERRRYTLEGGTKEPPLDPHLLTTTTHPWA